MYLGARTRVFQAA